MRGGCGMTDTVGREMNPKILVVDDDDNTREIIRDIIELIQPDADVRTAASNREAFQCLEEFLPDLITTDIVRAGGDGYEFLTELRSRVKTRPIPVVAIRTKS